MSRTMDAATEAEIVTSDLAPAILFEGEFASGTLRLWTGYGTLNWNGFDWTGAGSLLGIGSIEETVDVTANGTTIALSGVPTTLVSAAINDAQQGLAGRLYLALLASDGSIIGAPALAFVGRLDVPELTDDADTCTITISYESRLIDLTKPREWRYTHESQQVLYPGDLGFEYVTTIQDKDIKWGR